MGYLKQMKKGGDGKAAATASGDPSQQRGLRVIKEVHFQGDRRKNATVCRAL